MTFLFVIGTGRCGSTLLARLLAAHPDVGFVATPDDPLTPWEAYELLAEEVSPVLVAPCRDLTARDVQPVLRPRLRRFFEERARAQGKPVFLHKFTGWPRAGFVHEALPGSRFVHLVRDGRAVASSLLQVPWWQGRAGPGGWGFGPLPPAAASAWEASGRSFALLAGLEWKLLLHAFDAAREAIPADRWLDLRYEDLVADPRTELTALLRFAGLDWSEEVAERLEALAVSRSRTDAYRDELRPEDLQLLDASLAPELVRWAYLKGPVSPGLRRRHP